MSNPTRYPSGLATSFASEPLGNYPLPDPFHTASQPIYGVSTFQSDFQTWPSGDYTITGTSSAVAAANVVGGAITITPGGTTTATAVYKIGNTAQFIAGQRLWYTTRLQASAVAGNVSFYAGLRAGSSANDGIWFAKAAASTSVNLVSVVNGTSTTLLTGVATAAAATNLDLGLYFDGTDLLVYAGGVLVGRVAAPTIGSSGTTLTNALLTPVWQITPTATDTLTVDFVLSAQEVLR